MRLGIESESGCSVCCQCIYSIGRPGPGHRYGIGSKKIFNHRGTLKFSAGYDGGHCFETE